MKNKDWLIYTYKHRRAFVYIAKRIIRDEALLQQVLERSKIHDMDKMIMYLFLDQTQSQLYHVHTKMHHLECQDLAASYEYLDLVETVIDYECAPYTKPDKPLNAFDFLHKLVELGYVQRDKANELFAIMHEFGIDTSYQVTEDEEGMRFVESLQDATEEEILLEILEYTTNYPLLAAQDMEHVKEELQAEGNKSAEIVSLKR